LSSGRSQKSGVGNRGEVGVEVETGDEDQGDGVGVVDGVHAGDNVGVPVGPVVGTAVKRGVAGGFPKFVSE
jgi:hypothetical protein